MTNWSLKMINNLLRCWMHPPNFETRLQIILSSVSTFTTPRCDPLDKFFGLSWYDNYEHYVVDILIKLDWLIDWLICWYFNATFSNISAISWRPVLMVEEAGVPGENHRPWASNWWALSLAAAGRVHLFLYFTKPGANPRRIGDRLVWVVR